MRYNEYSGLLDCGRKVIRKNGLLGLYQGYNAALFRDIPSTMLYFGSYELSKQALTKNGKEETWKILLSGSIAGVSFWAFTYPM